MGRLKFIQNIKTSKMNAYVSEVTHTRKVSDAYKEKYSYAILETTLQEQGKIVRNTF